MDKRFDPSNFKLYETGDQYHFGDSPAIVLLDLDGTTPWATDGTITWAIGMVRNTDGTVVFKSSEKRPGMETSWTSTPTDWNYHLMAHLFTAFWPADDTAVDEADSPVCPQCGSDNIDLAPADLADGICECRECGWQMMNWRSIKDKDTAVDEADSPDDGPVMGLSDTYQGTEHTAVILDDLTPFDDGNDCPTGGQVHDPDGFLDDFKVVNIGPNDPHGFSHPTIRLSYGLNDEHTLTIFRIHDHPDGRDMGTMDLSWTVPGWPLFTRTVTTADDIDGDQGWAHWDLVWQAFSPLLKNNVPISWDVIVHDIKFRYQQNLGESLSDAHIIRVLDNVSWAMSLFSGAMAYELGLVD